MRNLCPVLTLQVMNLHHFSLHVVLYINEYGPQVWKIFSYSETKCFFEMNLINFLVSMYKVQVHASGILFVLIKHYEISF